jgi:hypothetical protein
MIETGPEIYALALERYHAAHHHADNARAVWEEAVRAAKGAEKSLADHEAMTGVPAWQHLEMASTRAECRIGLGCQVHWPGIGSPWHGGPAAAGGIAGPDG